MTNDIITTLHPDQDPNTNLFPNIKKENIPIKSIDRNKLGDDVNSLLNSINELHPSGVDISTNILAFTINKGIYIGSDTGHWYYWDGTQYVDGGVYQVTEIADNSIGIEKTNFITLNNMFDGEITLNYYISNSGAILPYDGWNLTSNFIKIKSNKNYKIICFNLNNERIFHGNLYISFYTNNGVFIQTNTNVSTDTILSIPNNAYMMKISGSNKVVNERTVIGESDYIDTLEKFEPYSIEIKGLNYKGYCNDKISSEVDKIIDYDKTVKSINRIGIHSIAPENTLPAFDLAIKEGFKYLLCDVEWTSDGIPVLLHDATINRTARNSDGTIISETINVTEKTYDELSVYDFGIAWGLKYAGIHLPKVVDFLKFCKYKGVNAYLEIKVGVNEERITNLAKMVKEYGMQDNVTFAITPKAINNKEYGRLIKNVYNKYRIGLMSSQTIGNAYIDEAVNLRFDINDVFLFGWDNLIISDLVKNYMLDNNVSIEIGTINTKDGIKEFLNNHPYVRGIESDTLIAGKVISEE